MAHRPRILGWLGAQADWLLVVFWPLLGLVPGAAGALDVRVLLGFLVLTALPLGLWLSRTEGGGLRTLGCAALGLGCSAIWMGCAWSWGPVAPPLGPLRGMLGLAPVAGALVAGLGLGAWLCRRAPTWQPAAYAAGLALGLLLVALPTRAGLGGEVLARRAPAWSAGLLAVSPWTLCLEAAGFDWERHPAVYEPAGSDWSSGARRGPGHRVAAWLALVGGGLLGLLARLLAGRRREAGRP
jgi:hypothetical protein